MVALDGADHVGGDGRQGAADREVAFDPGHDEREWVDFASRSQRLIDGPEVGAEMSVAASCPLGARLALAFLGVTMGALAILVTLVLVAAERDVSQLAQREQEETLSAVAHAAAAAYAEAGRWDGADYDGVVALADFENSHVTVLDSDGRTVAASPGPARTARVRTTPVEVAGQRVGSVRIGFAAGGLPSGEKHLRDASSPRSPPPPAPPR